MTSYVVNERVVSDDIVYIADEGKAFKGGYVAILEYNTYANEWSDRKHVRRFRTLEAMDKFLNKRYPEFDVNLLAVN